MLVSLVLEALLCSKGEASQRPAQLSRPALLAKFNQFLGFSWFPTLWETTPILSVRRSSRGLERERIPCPVQDSCGLRLRIGQGLQVVVAFGWDKQSGETDLSSQVNFRFLFYFYVTFIQIR